MKYIGIDIGTTTISSVLIDSESGCIVDKKTIPNSAQIPADHVWERRQDPEKIEALCRQLLEDLTPVHEPLNGIGLTGQMHGIVFVDGEGKVCSDLITWQDERGNLPYREGQTYCEFMETQTGHPVATGYGLVSVFYELVNHGLPERTAQIATIPDYIALRLTGNTRVTMHPSNAASLGLFDPEKKEFYIDALKQLGIRPSLLPQVAKEECILGRTAEGTAVALPIGDNQASFLGAVGPQSNVLLNIGTGSQISVLTNHYDKIDGLEFRPYIDNRYLINGSSLCGGSAYAILEHFFRETAKLFDLGEGDAPKDLMQRMDRAAQEFVSGDVRAPEIDTRFRGTREKPSLRGSITGIGVANFTPGAFAYGIMRGICQELYEFYQKIPGDVDRPSVFIASGNAVRNSEVERRILSEVFQAPVMIPQEPEEAAYGSTLVAIHECERRSWEEIRRIIRYKELGGSLKERESADKEEPEDAA